jgi:tetratricopeptide (TPR) repeat protein
MCIKRQTNGYRYCIRFAGSGHSLIINSRFQAIRFFVQGRERKGMYTKGSPVGKFSTILTRQEAETYRAQGLHQEAIRLYDQFLAASPHIDTEIRTAIHGRIQDLQKEMQTAELQRSRPLTVEEITRIRNGWGSQASETEIWVCAQSFCRIGAFREALMEYDQLLRTAGTKKNYLQAAADCLVRLHTPPELPRAAERLAHTWAADRKAARSVCMDIAEHLQDQGHIEHARALHLHMGRQSPSHPSS